MCTASDTVSTYEPPLITYTTASTNVSCYGLADGEAIASGSDSAATYAYQWDAAAGNQSVPNATGLKLQICNYFCSNKNNP